MGWLLHYRCKTGVCLCKIRHKSAKSGTNMPQCCYWNKCCTIVSAQVKKTQFSVWLLHQTILSLHNTIIIGGLSVACCFCNLPLPLQVWCFSQSTMCARGGRSNARRDPGGGSEVRSALLQERKHSFEDNIHDSSGTNMPAWVEQQHIITIIREVHKPIEPDMIHTLMRRALVSCSTTAAKGSLC